MISLQAKDNYGELVITATIPHRVAQLPPITIIGFDNKASTITETDVKNVMNPLLSPTKNTMSTEKEIKHLPSFIMVKGVVVSMSYQTNAATGVIIMNASVIGSSQNFS